MNKKEKQFKDILDLNYKLNQINPANTKKYMKLLSKIVQKIDNSTDIRLPIYFDTGNTYFGKNCFINKDVKFIDYGGIHIGNNVCISMNAVIIANGHPGNPCLSNEWEDIKTPVIIKDGVWIGAGAIIRGPVTIGKNAVIGAGSVVTKNIPSNEVWCGNPATFLKKVEER